MLLGIYVSCSNRARRLCLIEHRFTPRPLSQRMHRFTRFTTRQSPSAPFASCNGLSFGAALPLACAKTRRALVALHNLCHRRYHQFMPAPALPSASPNLSVKRTAFGRRLPQR